MPTSADYVGLEPAGKLGGMSAQQDAAYGVPEAEWSLVQRAHRAAYLLQKCNARRRGIAWGFTLTTWMRVWLDSGRLPERGRLGHHYCMTRHGDTGAYAPGNVAIKTHRENLGEMARYSVPFGESVPGGRKRVRGPTPQERGNAAMAAWMAAATSGL